MKMKSVVMLVALFSGCGTEEAHDRRSRGGAPQDPYKDLREQLLQLQSELDSIAQTDWASCDGSLSDTAKNICKIAQAATDEARIEMRGAIADLATQLESQIQDTQKDVAELASVWKKLYGVDFPDTAGGTIPTLADCIAFNSNASTFQCVMVQGTAIQALQTTVAVLGGAVDGAMIPVTIGKHLDLARGVVTRGYDRLNQELRGTFPIRGGFDSGSTLWKAKHG